MGNPRWDNTEPYEPFRWVNTERSVPFRKANTDPSVQFRKANRDPSLQFRWGNTKFVFFKLLGKNLHESVRPLSHLQTSPGKSSCQMHSVKVHVLHFHTVILQKSKLKFGQSHINKLSKTLIVLVTSLICSVYFAYKCQSTMSCYTMPCHVMSCHVLCHVPCAIQRHLATETKSCEWSRL